MIKQCVTKNNNLIATIYKILYNNVKSLVYRRSMILLNLNSRNDLLQVIVFLKKFVFSYFNQLLDLYGVDLINFNSNYRFEVKYLLLSTYYNLRVLITIGVSAYEFVDSCTKLFSSSGWFEREAWDMFGVFFVGHKDLRRILTDYGFLGHPLRKDFPLIGFVEVNYDERVRSVVVEPLELMQDIRLFNSKERSW